MLIPSFLVFSLEYLAFCGILHHPNPSVFPPSSSSNTQDTLENEIFDLQRPYWSNILLNKPFTVFTYYLRHSCGINFK